MKHKNLTLWFALTAMITTSLPTFAELSMGVFPRRPAAVTVKAFKPLASELSEALGEKVTLNISKNFREFWKNVQEGKYDIVHYNQYHYVKSHAEQGYNAIVTNEEMGSNKIAGALAVRVDSGINTIEDLRGKTILFGGGKKAMGSYIAPTAVLKKNGLIEGKDYTAKFAKNPPSAVIGVYNKAADAAGSGNVILKVKGVTSKIDASQMKILAESESFTHLVWAVKKDMPAEKAEKITEFMTSLKASNKGKMVLKSAKVTGFDKADQNEFTKVREIIEFATGEKL